METDTNTATRAFESFGRIVVYSLFPITALVIIGGTVIWGPWISLILAFGWWKTVGHIG